MDLNQACIFNDAYVIGEAFRFRRFDIVKYLVNHCEETHYCDVLLSYAADSKKIEMVKFLISKGLNPWRYNNLPVRDAVINNDLEMFKYFVSLGLDVTFNNDYPIKVLVGSHGFVGDEPIILYVINLVLTEMRKYNLFLLLNKQINRDLIPLLKLNRYIKRYLYYKAWDVVLIREK